MKILLYLENKKGLANSGIGRAIFHQTKALETNGIEYTYNPKDTFDIAHLNSYQGHTYRLLKKYKKQGIKVISHGHSTHEDFKESFRCWKIIAPIYNSWLNRMYKNADLIITPTPYSKSLIENYPGVTCPVLAISNGLVLEEYLPKQTNVDKFISYFKIQPEDKIVIGVGFFFKRKGIDDFFETARRMPNVKFIWFGHLPKILTTHYVNQCIKNKPDNVMLPGYIKGDIIKGAYQRSTCMLFPTHEETEGIVALEALACHLPLIVRDVGVYKDWLTDGLNCYKGQNVDDFIEKINLCISKDQTNLTEAGYKVVKERSIEKVGAQLKQAYLDLLESKI
jgi:1,2-diacylglycerol-3-alpha-glucose alpha-1,2-glucosyltransferase